MTSQAPTGATKRDPEPRAGDATTGQFGRHGCGTSLQSVSPPTWFAQTAAVG